MKELKDITLDLNNYMGCSHDANRLCQEDYEFATVVGAMWNGKWAEQFKNKPKPEINKIYGAINRILGQKQRMEMNAKIISNSDEATDDGADLLQGRWRNDFQASNGVEAVNNADQEAFFGGFGAYKLVAKYEDDENPDPEKQFLCVEPIYSAPSSVVFSPSTRKDKSDCKQAWHVIRTSRKDIEEEYGTVASVNGQMDWFDWNTESDKDIYLAHYYEVVEKRITEYDFGGGYSVTTGDGIKDNHGNKLTRDELDELRSERNYEETRRKVKYVEYALISGDKILTKPSKLPFKRVPIIPQYGYYHVINGIEHYFGEVRKRRDPQMFFNTYHSSLMEIMQAPQVEKPEYTPEQIAEHAASRSSADVDGAAFVMSSPVINPTDGSIAHLGPIGVQKPPSIGTGLQAVGQQLSGDLLDMASSGQTTLPANASGEAVQQVNDRSDDVFQPLMQNSISATRVACEIWIDAAQKIYFSNQRQLRVQAADGGYSQVKTLEYDVDEDGNYGPFKNNAKGRYTAQVKIGESYKSKKEAELDTTLKMLQFADSATPQGQALLNQAIISTTGEGGARARKMANYAIINSMLDMGLDPDTENDEEKEYVEQRLQAMQNQGEQPSFEAQTERMNAEANMVGQQAEFLEQQNRQTDLNTNIAKVQIDAQNKERKQMSDDQVNYYKVQQGQEKLNIEREDKQFKNALEFAKVELEAGRDLNAELKDNMLIFDPATGDFQ